MFLSSSEPTGFLSATLLSRDFYPLHFFHERSVADRNPVGSDDVFLLMYRHTLSNVQNKYTTIVVYLF